MSRHHRILLQHVRNRRHQWGFASEYRVLHSYALVDEWATEDTYVEPEYGAYEPAWR